MSSYTRAYYLTQQEGSRRTAREVVPIVLDLIKPERIIDVGCGVGTWLVTFKERGVTDICGVDGDYVSRQMLQVPEERFVSHDLRKPLQMEGQYDLVVSLEVAEHLPSACAITFVDSLVSLGPVVLFSAAIPFQADRHHLNEQWPDYWVKLFCERGYVTIDCIRRRNLAERQRRLLVRTEHTRVRATQLFGELSGISKRARQ